jgi:glucose-6-phosphate 1-epimerase
MGAPNTIDDLNRRFEIPGIAQIVTGSGGPPKVSITTAAASGEMYLHGAHVTSWKPRHADEMLFVSARSRWQDGQPIRGGVPICFPWFAANADDPRAPMHGLVRTTAWQLESLAQTGDSVLVSMFTESSAETKKWWPADFRLIHRATFGPELRLELILTNTGPAPLRFEEALHTYFQVGDIQKAQLRGLDSIHYLDKTDSNREKTQVGPIAIRCETDRIYLNTPDAVELEDPIRHRRINIGKENSLTTVVWNPWVEKARALPDFGDDEWMHMVCVETCNVAGFAVTLGPGQQHRMATVIRVADL